MADALITIEMEGIPEDGGDVRLGEFIEELNALKAALRRTERLVVKSDAQAVDYKIISLSHSSPARVTVGISSRDPIYRDAPKKITRRLHWTLATVRSGHRYGQLIDSATLEALKSLSAPSSKHVKQITITTEKQPPVMIDSQFERSLARLLQGDETERDEIVGRVERIDIHNKNQFDIYPVIGSPRIRCSARASLQKEIFRAIGRMASVDGWALYHKDSPFPYAMKVEGIEIREDDDSLPKMQDLHGIAPNATDGKSGEDFIRELRDASW